MATTETKKAPAAKKTVAKKTVAKAAPEMEAEIAAPVTPVTKTATKAAAKKPTSLDATIYSMAGKEAGSIKLPENIFDVQWNADLVHQVVIGMQANARATTAHTKFRGEVAGGGKKPWKQKGTGRARHGSNRSPIWRGGGVTHGPRAEKNYSVKINRKMRLGALAAVLTRKYKDGEILFVDRFNFDAPKTSDAKKTILAIAKGSGVAELATKRKNAAILAFATKDSVAELSFRNFGSFKTDEVRNLNPMDLLNKKFLVIENPTESLAVLTTRFAKKA